MKKFTRILTLVLMVSALMFALLAVSAYASVNGDETITRVDLEIPIDNIVGKSYGDINITLTSNPSGSVIGNFITEWFRDFGSGMQMSAVETFNTDENDGKYFVTIYFESYDEYVFNSNTECYVNSVKVTDFVVDTTEAVVTYYFTVQPANYTATFNLNGGDIPDVAMLDMTTKGWTYSGTSGGWSKQFATGTSYSTIIAEWADAVPSIQGYVFDGWTPSTGTLTANTTFTANYKSSLPTPTVSDFTFTAPSNLTYDGTDKAATVISSKSGMGNITVSYSADGEDWTTTAPKNANTYLVKIDVAAGTSYSSASLTDASWKFTIEKATGLKLIDENTSEEITDKTYSKEYDGEGLRSPYIKANVAGSTVSFIYNIVFEDSIIDATLCFSRSAVGTDTIVIKAENPNYSDVPTVTITLTVNPKVLTLTPVTVSDKTYDGTTDATVEYGCLYGTVGTESVTISGAKGTFEDKNEGTDKNVTVSFTLYGTDAANYILPDMTLTATISPAQLTVTGSSAGCKTYDGTTDAVAHLGTVSGIIGEDDVTVEVTGTFEDKNATNGKRVTLAYSISGDDATNYYAPINEETMADIDPRPITITADDITSYVNCEYEPLTYKVTEGSLVEGDEITVILTTAADNAVIGESPINANSFGGADVANYDISFVSGTYNVAVNPDTSDISISICTAAILSAMGAVVALRRKKEN